ncbi:dynactin subunit 4 [Condylostylus longicornis]|uniref:dynactin subunit 4 n=1 Tax=Condylostylus longicornis TaxID=2530218 RepID=UPI00244DDBC9|nr:dynactin subunit 4 [Condylostylus longicornis]
MANFLQESPVKYVCSCGILNPITKLYFCRHCLSLRCGFCVCHEVDSHFCSNCLENIPSSEARHKKFRCNSCYVCPSCNHTLSAKAATVTVPRKQDEPVKEGEDPKTQQKKMYFLTCLACRWTSRDVGIPDQSSTTGHWPDLEYSNQARFTSIFEYYQAVVLQEKQEKREFWRRKSPKAHKYPSLTDRTGLTVSMIRRQIGWNDKNPIKAKPASISPSIASEEVQQLPEIVFTKPINLKNVTTIKQRHGQPAEQPYTVDRLYPQRKSLWIKRSLRCRKCEHNVIKPEFHPCSIKYRIQLFASYHVPEVRLVSLTNVKLTPGEKNQVILKFSNPTMQDMTITIEDLPSESEEAQLIDEIKHDFEKQVQISETGPTSTPVTLGTSLSRQPSLNEEPRPVDVGTNTTLEILDSSFILNHRDDSAEFDEEVQIEKEEPEFIVWRKSNKVSIKLNFTPNDDLEVGNDVILGFTIQYTYVNTVTNTPEKKKPQTHALTCRVYVKVGSIE